MAAEQQTKARLTVRLPADVHVLLKYAAEIQGCSLTAFVVTAACEAAFRTIGGPEILEVSRQDQKAIAAAVLNPVEPVPALRKAFESRRKLLGS